VGECPSRKNPVDAGSSDGPGTLFIEEAGGCGQCATRGYDIVNDYDIPAFGAECLWLEPYFITGNSRFFKIIALPGLGSGNDRSKAGCPVIRGQDKRIGVAGC